MVGVAALLGVMVWMPPQLRVALNQVGSIADQRLEHSEAYADTAGQQESGAGVRGSWGGGNALPPPPDDAAATRLLPPVFVTEVGTHAFLRQRADGSPVGYDPCRPLHYVVNPAGMPPGGLQMIRESVQAVSQATGLAFEEDGVVTEAPTTARDLVQLESYGNRWAPLLIAWSEEDSYPLLGGNIAGVAGGAWVTVAGSERLVTGQAVLDTEAFADMLSRPGGYELARSVVMHELGHVVGLDHVDDPNQLMFQSTNDVLSFAAGDLQGLAAVGSGPCWKDM